MPSTHLSLHYHVVFGTKDRIAIIAPEWRSRLHAYLGGVLREIGAIPESVGGVADHVHILAGLKATHCLSIVLRDLKRTSSEWVHSTAGLRQFAWQEGYGAFTVSASKRGAVRKLHCGTGGASQNTNVPRGIRGVLAPSRSLV